MEIESLSQIKKILDYYDNQKKKYLELIINDNVKFDLINNEIFFIFEDEEIITHDFELLGYFDNQNSIWIWGWLLNESSEKIKICKGLLDYGLKLEPKTNSNEHFLIKGLLVNSRISVEEDSQLDVNLAIYSYLARDKIKFIYPRRRYIDEENKKFVTFYYFIK